MMNFRNDISVDEKRIYSRILNSNRKRKRVARKVYVKKRDKLIAFFICAVILFLAFALIYYYNLFINLQYNVEANLAQIDAQLQKRKNLIINLGITVIDYSKHEREVFTYLGELRAIFKGGNPRELSQDSENSAGIQNQNTGELSEDLANLEKTLSQLMAVAEQYPDLKLSENFQKYMDAIQEFENKIAELRMDYNDSVNEYSTAKDQFPGNIFADILRFKEFEYFQLDIDENNFIKVEY